jgi:hypothetical protein
LSTLEPCMRDIVGYEVINIPSPPTFLSPTDPHPNVSLPDLPFLILSILLRRVLFQTQNIIATLFPPNLPSMPPTIEIKIHYSPYVSSPSPYRALLLQSRHVVLLRSYLRPQNQSQEAVYHLRYERCGWDMASRPAHPEPRQ